MSGCGGLVKGGTEWVWGVQWVQGLERGALTGSEGEWVCRLGRGMSGCGGLSGAGKRGALSGSREYEWV